MTGNSHKNPFARGVDAERERIIALLENKSLALCPCQKCETVRGLVALIKGEN